MYENGRTQLCVGACASMISWVSGLSFTQDVVPIISYIGVCAGAFIALHGVGVIMYNWFKKLREHNPFDLWY